MWYIDKDILDGKDVMILSAGDEEKTPNAVNYPFPFRLLDDDEIVYFTGRSDDGSDFEPLDDYGMPDSGCTDIQYLIEGEWASL
jgi:hypothetical protein